MTTTFVVHPSLTRVRMGSDGYHGEFGDLFMLVSEAVEQDGKRWRHCSVSRRDHKLPTYEDLKHLKRLCVGDDKTAYQVFPPKDRHIDIAGPKGVEVLHLWCCLDGDVTPDFARGGNSI